MEKESYNFTGCTIASRNYLAQANILARSFRLHHPGGRFVILVVDRTGKGERRDDGVEVLSLDEIGLAPNDRQHMPIIYDVTEFSTAVKPWLLHTLLNQGSEVVMYLDPDIEIFAPLTELALQARTYGIVLTPHVTEAIPRDGRQLSENDILGSGIYNLGFISVAREAEAFLKWWKVRLRRECIIDPTRMRFTDQRWVDFVPGLFPHCIVRDETYNVAYWNLHSRELRWQNDHYDVNGERLHFFHFSGYDPQQPHLLSKHQGLRPRILFSEHPGVAQICADYREQLLADDFVRRKKLGYGFDYLPSGLKIDRHIRHAYREALRDFEDGNADAAPPDPFANEGEEKFLAWLNAPLNSGVAVVTRYMLAVHAARADLRADFPDPLMRHAPAFHAWFVSQGKVEEKVADALLPARPRFSESMPLAGEDPVRVTVAGYFRAELGIGEAARLLVTALDAANVPYQTINYRETVSRQEHPFVVSKALDQRSDVVILCINADQTPAFIEKMGADFFEGRYVIGFWFWEVSEFPAELHPAFQCVNEVWVASEFMRDAIKLASPHPVTKVPLPIVKPEIAPVTTGEFTFFYSFDFMSVFERKNPLGLVAAFRQAFQEGEGPRLLIKTINGDKHVADLEKLRLAIAGRNDIQLWDGYVTAAEKDRMMAGCSCYISLHRSEGYGLTLAEAMSLAKPTIATAYSGNMDFMTAENSYLCGYKLREVGPGKGPYPAQAQWAEPNLREAANLMRQVYNRCDNRGAEEVRTRFSPSVTGKVMRERLDEIRTTRNDEALRAFGRYEKGAAEKLRSRLTQAERELWELKVKRADASASAQRHEQRLREIERSGFWRSIKPLRKLFLRSKDAPVAASGDLVFEIEHPTSWKLGRAKLRIDGWCYSRSGRELAGVRAKVQRQGRFARYGIERLDVWREQDFLPQARFSGFSIEVNVPEGASHLTMEAIVQGASWESFYETEMHRVGIEPTTR